MKSILYLEQSNVFYFKIDNYQDKTYLRLYKIVGWITTNST